VTDLFAPPAGEWTRVSPKLAVLRRVLVAVAAALGLVALGAAQLLWGLPGWAWAAGLGVAVGGGVWGWWLVGRNVASWGYAERDEDLYIRHGVMFRKLVVVPYGRMQYVDVNAGPVDQLLGIAKVHLHTASPGTSAVIPGLPADDAARLRDRLTALGQSQAAGL
jgi:membrane protein YdbS with pleckstrin-like domain